MMSARNSPNLAGNPPLPFARIDLSPAAFRSSSATARAPDWICAKLARSRKHRNAKAGYQRASEKTVFGYHS